MLTLTRRTAAVKPSDNMTTRLLRAIRTRQSTQLPHPPQCIVVHSSHRVRPGYGLACTPATMRRIDLAPAVGATPLRALHPVTSASLTTPVATMPEPTPAPVTSASPAFSLSARHDRPERSWPMPLSFDNSEPFATKYAPRHLAEFHGNEDAIAKLTRWSENPSECAILLSGATGTGKTTAASAFGRAIGVNLDDSFGRGGYHEIPPGLQTKEAIQSCLSDLRYYPIFGSGWRIVVVNECDYAHDNVLNFWLGVIDSAESIRASYPKTIFLFTVESADRLKKKRAAFVDRCRSVEFTSDPADLATAAQSYADSIFQAEIGTDAPALDVAAEGLLDDAGRLSMRRVASWCEAVIRDGRKPVTIALREVA